MTLGVDVGGTFTDVVFWDGTQLHTVKTPSTPDQSAGVVDGARRALAGASSDALLHGTTVATNALLERRGARVSLVTTAGFEDVIEIARQDRPSLYDSFADRPHPLVDRSSRHGIRRLDGSDMWTEDELADLAARVATGNPQAVAVALLYGYARPELEERIAGALSGDVEVARASRVVPEFREYERTISTVINAFLAPETATYLRHLRDRVREADLPDHVMVMRSSGGLLPVDRAAALPVSILLSGPAGGAVASAAMGELLGDDRLISFDMGGTSTDVARIDGGVPEVAYERKIEGFPIRMPAVAIHTVGAGGGSVGWVDPGGALRVGPRSAGAMPGPASYGRGGQEPAVTDANVELGRIGGTSRLGGELALQPELATQALTGLGAKLGLDPLHTAIGMVEVVEAHMERAIRKVTVEEGASPRGARLVAFGGAGGLHATALARRLEMAGVIVPPLAGVFSAFGLLLGPPRIDAARSVTITAPVGDEFNRHLTQVRDDAATAFANDMGIAARELRLIADTRYVGQAHETPVPVEPGMAWSALAGRFHQIHHDRNGFSRPDDPVEVVTLRCAAIGRAAFRIDQLPPVRAKGEARRGTRPVVLEPQSGRVEAVTVWWRPGLGHGDELIGPAVIEEPEATTYVGPGERVRVHASGALEVDW